MPKQMSALLTVENLTKKFGSRSVLSDVSFNVRGGEVLGLIGPNGSGKTTLFECLAGLLPSSGTVEYANRALEPTDRKTMLYYVPDGIRPWPDQTLEWAVGFFQELFERGDGAHYIDALGLSALRKS